MADATGENTRKIVVGVDGSPSSIDALRWAVRHAQLIGSSVEALMAWEYPSSSGVVPPVSEDLDFDADSRRALDAAIEEAFGAARPVKIGEVIAEGHPGPTLVDASKDASLLVVGSRGHGELVGMLIGSISEYCVMHAFCPVLVFRGRKPERSSS